MKERLEEIVRRLRWLAGRFRAGVAAFRGASIGGGTVLGPRTRVDRSWALRTGTRCELEADVWVKIVDNSARVVLGDHVFLGRGVEIDAAESVAIGSHALLAPGVFITDHAHCIAGGLRIDEQGCRNAPVSIGSDVWVGARATILPGVTIGDGAVIGAGALVNRDVAANAIVAGVPARVIGSRVESRPARTGT